MAYLTKQGYDRKMQELAELEAQRPAIKAAIAEARDKGDLSENAEYDAAKEAQGMLEMKIAKLKDLVANARIIDFVAKRLKAREGLFFKNMDRYGNTSAASIPIALDELVQSGALRPGMWVLMVGFGGGLTWAGALLRW